MLFRPLLRSTSFIAFSGIIMSPRNGALEFILSLGLKQVIFACHVQGSIDGFGFNEGMKL